MSIWKAVVTEKGEALLAKMTQGKNLEITQAKVGAGQVSVSLLKQQTSVSTMKQTATVEPVGYPGDGMCAIPVSITNESITASYDAWQIGIFANDPDEGEIMFFIAQAEDKATNIPSKAQMASYKTQVIFHVEYGSADSVSVTVNPANAVSQAGMENYVASAAEVAMDAAPNRYVWKVYKEKQTPVTNQDIDVGLSSGFSINYSESIELGSNKRFVLANEQTLNAESATDTKLNTIKGKYVDYGGMLFFIPTDATFSKDGMNLVASKAMSIGTVLEYVGAKSKDAYPTNGKHTDGNWYEYQRQLAENPYTYGTEDLVAGESELETGKLYFVYE